MDILKLQGIMLFVITFLSLALTLFLWRRGRKDKAAFHLGFIAFFSGLFAFTCGLTFFFWNLPDHWWMVFRKSAWVGVFIIPAYLTFVYYFTNRTKYLKLKSFIWYLGAGIIAYLAFTTSYIVKSSEIKYPYISTTIGMLDPPARFYILLGLVTGLVYILKEYFKSQGFRRLQIRYFILGLSIYCIGGIIFTGILPLIQGEPRYFHFPAIFSIIFTGLTSYAVLRYRLMNLQFVLGRTAVYISSFLGELAMAFLIIFFNSQLGSPLPINLILIIVLIIITLTFQPLFRFFERIAGKYFYYTLYTLQTSLFGLAKQLSQTPELDKLTNLINCTLLDALKLDKIGIILKEPEKKQFLPQQLINFKKEDILSLFAKGDQSLIEYLKKIKKPLVREEISFLIREKEEERKLNILRKEMEKNEIALLLPLFIKEELIGIIILGNKLSGEAYTIQDIDFLTILTAQAAPVFNNALSYAEIEKRKAELERFYKLTIGRELRMIELKKRIRELEKKELQRKLEEGR